jgi:SIR2-like domain
MPRFCRDADLKEFWLNGENVMASSAGLVPSVGITPMPETLSDKTWDILLGRIKERRCTPFLGAGACYGSLPLGAEIAQKWAADHGYPFTNPNNLIEVAQFLAVKYDPLFPKEQILQQFAGIKGPDFSAADEPHAILADLPLPVYMTTNYDDFMVQALKRRHRDPRRELCRWNETLEGEESVFDIDFVPTPANPVVYHLHGHTIPESLVLTEDDYLSFLANIARNAKLLPMPIQKALDRSTCLFIGYRLADWNFRVLFQGLRPRLKLLNIAILKPSDDSDRAREQREYLNKYYASMDLQVYWGTARQFAGELRERWAKCQ